MKSLRGPRLSGGFRYQDRKVISQVQEDGVTMDVLECGHRVVHSNRSSGDIRRCHTCPPVLGVLSSEAGYEKKKAQDRARFKLKKEKSAG